ncbi:MAG: protein kinase [Nannocystis sp.]|nr:protein kinase [Nannocystis sp.]
MGETPEGQPYMALEYLDGEPLSVRVARGPVPWRDVATFGIQLAGAVHALHAAGIIHRDLKPANIMLTTGTAGLSAAKLVDLGLARVSAPFLDVQDALFTPEPPERHQTQLGYPIGTPPYLPPEAGGCPADERLDVYSLGVTLYELCTQVLPKATGGRPIREVCPGSDAPDDLSRLLQAALAPDPTERLASADHLQRGLEAILAAHPRAQGARQLFGGSYDLLGVLGVGASAVVFRASDRRLSREVAVKVLRDAEPSEDDAIRFRRAAKVLSALRHPNIPRILHFGAHDGKTFAVTELCPGSPATIFMRPDNYLRPDEVVSVGLQLAGALAAGHAAGIVYRDLHPGNVLIDRGTPTRAWIFDFDQAQVSAEFYAVLTERWATPPEERTEPKRGKPLQNMDHAAPELRGGAAFSAASGAAFSAASDVYALGLLLYRLLTGRRPILSGGGPRPPSELCPACPPGLERMILTMLSPSPDNRPTLDVFQTVLTEDLEDSDDTVAEAERPATGEHATAAAVTADTVTAEPAAAFISATDGAVTAAADTASGRHNTADLAPDRRPRRAPGWWALGLTAVACLAIGRATVPRDEPDPPTLALPASLTDEQPDAPTPSRVHTPLALAMDDNPAAPAPDPKRDVTPRAMRREAVTEAEALEAAQRAVPSLRGCTGIPRHVTAGLDIVRGRGVVTALNLLPVDLDDPNSWHSCAVRSLKPVWFPVSEKAGHVQIRLPLR